MPPVRRDLIKRHRYLVPNSIVVSRGCPHHCDFCCKDASFAGGRSFCTQAVDAALAEIDRLPGRHLYVLDDHLFGKPRFAEVLFAGMAGTGRVWQAAGTVDSVLAPGLLDQAVAAGLRSLFVGFETINRDNLAGQRKRQNIGRDCSAVVRRLHDLGVMVNARFVFGMDGDRPDVLDRTVSWAVEQGIETATFHIMTPYPGHGAVHTNGGAEPDAASGLGPLRHQARGLPPGRDDQPPTGGRILAGVPRRLPVERDLARRLDQTCCAGPVSARRVRRRLEEIRTVVGSAHLHRPGAARAARPGIPAG